MERRHHRWLSLLALALIGAGLTGCSTQSSSAPFHIYNSPLVESEMPTPTQARADNSAESPGVEARQLFVYRQFQRTTGTDQRPPAAPAPSDPSGPVFDRVTPPDQPVLASYTPQDFASDAQPSSGQSRNVEVQGSIDADHGADIPEATSQESAAFVYATLKINEIHLDREAGDEVPSLYRQCRSSGEVFHSGQPDIGDLVFFHNTYDRNEDRRNNDWYTLAGMVSRHLGDGSVEFLAFDGDEVSTFVMNLNDPANADSEARDQINSQLRAPDDDDPPYTQYLAGELFAGYCNVLGDRPELILIDNWSPSMDLAELKL